MGARPQELRHVGPGGLNQKLNKQRGKREDQTYHGI